MPTAHRPAVRSTTSPLPSLLLPAEPGAVVGDAGSTRGNTRAPDAAASSLMRAVLADPEAVMSVLEDVLASAPETGADDGTSPMLPMLMPVSTPHERGLGIGLFLGTTGGTPVGGGVDDIEFPLIIPVIPEDPGQELDPVRRTRELRPRVRIKLGTYVLAMLAGPAAVGIVMWVAQSS